MLNQIRAQLIDSKSCGLSGRRQFDCRFGFTVIELLVAITLIAILTALILPAVQNARQSSRRIQCLNNIRQVALACESFHTTHSRYPYGQMFDSYGTGPDSTAWSFLAQILPFIEKENLYESGGIPTTTLAESGVADATIALYLCPSDSTK